MSNLQLLLDTLKIPRSGPHCLCRFCGSSDGLSVFRGEHDWAWRCHSCGRRGSAVGAIMQVEKCSFHSAADIATIQTGRRPEWKLHFSTSENAPVLPEPRMGMIYDYLNVCLRSVVDNDAIFQRAAQFRRVDRNTCGRLCVGFDPRRRVFAFPICHNQKIVAVKTHRAVSSESAREPKSGWLPCGTTPVEKPRHGFSTLWPDPSSVNITEDVWLCEGELKSLRLRSIGLQAFSPTTGSSFSWPPWIVRFFFGAKKIIIIVDDDDAGRQFERRARAALHFVSSVSSFTLGTNSSGKKIDANDVTETQLRQCQTQGGTNVK